ncbi:MAG TPA: class I SAM-dependent methyltransferase [Solirubrobacteraceae bacterium]|nr:class I SAM-dependent methyltransferase [Solirubrobacteraceae bacterium]
MSARAAATIWRNGGARGLLRTASAAIRMEAPLLLRGRRTAASVGAYYDLVTDISRSLYGDNFHFGYFPTGEETLTEAHDAHTDLVAQLASLQVGSQVLDIGCGIGAPAMRIVRRYDCDVTGINISREQVRQGRELIAAQAMSDRVRIERGDARKLPFEDCSFDAIICVEVAGDICVSAADKQTLIAEMFRVLRPGGGVGFSDLALRDLASRAERKVLRGVFYDDGSNLVTDWPALFTQQGFAVDEHRCILEQTMATWAHVSTLYAGDASELALRYGKAVARRTGAQIDRLPEILRRLGTFPVLAARKPLADAPLAGAVALAREA